MRKKGNTVLAGLIICLLLVFLAAAGKLFGAYLKYQKGDVSYEKLQEYVQEPEEEESPESKKEKEERLKDQQSDKVADSKEEAGTEDTVTISAGSIEELLSKIETYNFNTRSDSVQTAGERQIGQNFDFRG